MQQLRTIAGLTVSTRTDAGDLHDGSAWTELAWIDVAAGGAPQRDVTLVAVNVAQSARVAQRAVAGLAIER